MPTSSSSKLDYLSKYLSTGDNDEKSKKKKKKKKKKNKKQEKILATESVREYDDEDSKVALLPVGDVPSDEDDEDRPTIVPSEELPVDPTLISSQVQPRGTWNTITAATTSNTNTIKEDERRPQRRRYDSSDDDDGDEKSNNNNDDERRQSDRHRRRRYDSENDDEEKEQPITKEEIPSNSSAVKRRRKRHDSFSSQEEEEEKPHQQQQQQQRRRYDSEDENDEKVPTTSVKLEEEGDDGHRRQRRRYDSSSSDDDDDDDNEETDNKKKKKTKMSSGHQAGLQNYQDFNVSELAIQKKKQRDAQIMVDKYGMGETVYRDKEGKRTTTTPAKMTNEQQQKQLAELNMGKVQREERENRARELQILQESSFARQKDDDRLEAIRKSEIRKEDPMAAYALKQQQQQKGKTTKKRKKRGSNKEEEEEEEKSTVEARPMYKGPPPKANRFGIRPGYRWDGVDRGNGWEDKLLARQYMVKAKQEEAYRWRSADM